MGQAVARFLKPAGDLVIDRARRKAEDADDRRYRHDGEQDENDRRSAEISACAGEHRCGGARAK